jgi:hypothetical protein
MTDLVPLAPAEVACGHGHMRSDEPSGTEYIVRWKCLLCGSTVYNDANLRRLRASLALRETTVASLLAVMTEARDSLAETVEDVT